MRSKAVRQYAQPKYPTRLEIAARPALLHRHQPPAWRKWPSIRLRKLRPSERAAPLPFWKRLGLDIQNLQDDMDMKKERLGMILERIQDLELQRKRPTRITVWRTAATVPLR